MRLSEGRREAVTVEGGDPVAAAERFAADGASWLHLVDLDGAFSGAPDLDLVSRIAAVGRAGAGRRRLPQPRLRRRTRSRPAQRACSSVPPRSTRSSCQPQQPGSATGIVVAIDARHGTVTVDGWTRSAELTPAELARPLRRRRHLPGPRDERTAGRNALGPDLPLLQSVLADRAACDRSRRHRCARRPPRAPRARLRRGRDRKRDLARPVHAPRSAGARCVK